MHRYVMTLQVWAEACAQIFFSIGPAWGGITTLASYNKFHTDVHKYVMLLRNYKYLSISALSIDYEIETAIPELLLHQLNYFS